ncbi:MAG TPA: amino acid permease [Kofleriaceae bacterium]|nr:amino acid permease [Kofleriaceae bacterium]
MTASTTPEEEERAGAKGLVRGLGPWAAASLVVGTIIGTGVFIKTAEMAAYGPSAGWILAAWGAAGLLSLFGAMTYAELGGMFPAAGGEYVYLRRGYGPGMGYLYAWNRFWIATPGSIAAYAVGAVIFLGPVLPPELGTAGGRKVLAIGLIAVFTGITCLDVRSGGRLQTALTVLKVVMIAGLAAGALLAPHGTWRGVWETGAFPGWSAFGAMVLAALWAYDGWNNLPMAAGEVKDPSRNLPRAIVGGSLVVFAIYAVVNLGYFHAVPMSEILTSAPLVQDAPSVASRVASQLFGGLGQVLFAAAIAFSALSAMNGSMLTGARVPYAVATDGLAPRSLARLSPRGRIPITAVIVQGVLSCLYATGGGFDDLTDAVVFASWMFYALNAGSVLMLRRREPDRPRPFRVPGFPIVPLIYVGLSVLLLASTVYEKPVVSAIGIGTTALGGLVFLVRYRRRAAA